MVAAKLLPLESDRWKQLSHAYGDASDVPDQLRRIYASSDNESVWSLYDNVLHQGSVSDSAYAVVPHIVTAAESVAVTDRLPYLLVVANTNDGYDRVPIPKDLRTDYEASVESARELGLEYLGNVKSEVNELPYLFEMIASTHNLPALARSLHDFSNDEFNIECSRCDSLLRVETDNLPFRTYLESDSTRSPTKVLPNGSKCESKANDLESPTDGKLAMPWLVGMAQRCGYNIFAEKIRCMYGTGTCPSCDHQFNLYYELEQAC